MGPHRTIVVLLGVCARTAESSRCNGDATPGPRNLNPVDTAAPVFVRHVQHGKLYTVGQGDDKRDLVHLWGTAYQNGYAMGSLLGEKVPRFIGEVYTYMEGQIIANLANETWCAEHVLECRDLRVAMKMGLGVALDLSYERTAPYIQPYVMEELQGLADSTQLRLVDIRNVMWLGELTRGSCSMFGASGSATQSRGGSLLQLRALDWDVEGPFKNYATVTVYHPNKGDGHAWANVAFSGFTASVTGFSEARLGISEIGVSYPDETFGPETYLAAGYPFGYLLRDVLQFDTSLAEATHRITTAKRTCDLILGVGDGSSDDFSAFQYSPNVATVIKPDSLLPVNDTWHPPIADITYFGMDWICPNDNAMLAHQLQRFHGQLTPEVTISDIVSYVGTGDLHVAIYDHATLTMYVATARPDGGAGPLEAYRRQFTALNMSAIFAEPPPAALM